MSSELEDALKEHSQVVEDWGVSLYLKYDWPTTADDFLHIVDRRTGCHFIGDKLKHTDKCLCDDLYDQEAQNV